MRTIIVVWANDRDYFLDEVCLLEGARWHKRFLKGKVDVLVIHGWHIVEEFRDELADLNYVLHDATRVLDVLRIEFQSLHRYYGQFHFHNLMRWLVIDEYFREHSYISFDSDLVISSDVVASPLVHGSTFTSTSTCFAVINDDHWMRGYREGLVMLNADREDFKKYWDRIKDAFILGPVDSEEINEETYVRYLSKSGRVPNALPPDFPFWLTPIHLSYVGKHLPLQTIDLPVTYQRSESGELFNDQPLAFIHFQHHFKEYLGTHLMYRNILQIESLGRLEPDYFRFHGRSHRLDLLDISRALRARVVKGEFGQDVRKVFTRRAVMEEFLFNQDFSAVFSDKHWHTPGFFK